MTNTLGIDAVTEPEPMGALKDGTAFSREKASRMRLTGHIAVVGEEHGCGGRKLDNRLGIQPARPVEQAELIGSQMNVSEQLFGSLA